MASSGTFVYCMHAISTCPNGLFKTLIAITMLALRLPGTTSWYRGTQIPLVPPSPAVKVVKLLQRSTASSSTPSQAVEVVTLTDEHSSPHSMAVEASRVAWDHGAADLTRLDWVAAWRARDRVM